MSILHTKHTLIGKIFFRPTIIGGYVVGAYALFLC